MIINHNIPALNTYNRLVANNLGMSRSLEKLASGLRINKAADDAAGLAISEKMRAQIRGLDQASRNAQDGISLIQTAEGALNETHSILQRMRELAVQAANDTYTSQDRVEIQKEIDQLASEVDRIANTTEFNTKKLLDGSTSALVSSDKLTTRIFMRDGLRVLDQFGQKAPGGGNFKLEIEATPGVNQVQKTDIFKVKHDTFSLDVIDIQSTTKLASEANGGINVKSLQAGNYELFTANTIAAASGAAVVGQQFNQKDPTVDLATIAATFDADSNTSSLFTVVDKTLTSITVQVDSHQYEKDGTYSFVSKQIKITLDDTAPTTVTLGGTTSVKGLDGLQLTLEEAGEFTVGDKFVINTTAEAAAGDDSVTLGGNGFEYEIVFDKGGFDEKTTSIKLYQVNSKSGSVSDGEIALKFEGTMESSAAVNNADVFEAATANSLLEIRRDISQTAAVSLVVAATGAVGAKPQISVTGATITANMASDASVKDLYDALKANADAMALIDIRLTDVAKAENKLVAAGTTSLTGDTAYAAKFDVEGQAIGDLALSNTKLYDVDKFWDASGNFILTTPQVLTLVQGDGKKTTVTIAGTDTFADVRDKLNHAIAVGLGQKDSVQGIDSDKFVSFVEGAPVTDSAKGLETVNGTFVIRSAIAGDEGKISFVGDDATIAALSLTTIQNSQNNIFTVKVTDAHNPNNVVANNVKISNNNLVGVVHQNVDVQFSANTGVHTEWDTSAKNFKFTGGPTYKDTTFVHLADNTLVLHIGANQKQDIASAIGNMGTRSLGINNIQVTSNALANEAIGKLDNAISTVSSERSKLGALQNRLEHTINNLTTTSENLTAAESRIRDVDMAKEMMAFTKYSILAQAATAMLAQANQMPQMVLQLLR